MTREFQQMLQLAAMGATSHSIDVDCSDIDWKKIDDLARKQKVTVYIAHALKGSRVLSCPDEIRKPMIQRARGIVVRNAINRSDIIRLLEDMEAAGIHAVLLKGYAIADCYAVPEFRTSSDADIWINPKDEDRACEFMQKQGFSVEPRWKNGHHAVCHHPRLGCVELHVILYDEIVEEVWFGKMDGSEFVTEPHLSVDSKDGRYYTLGYTDHFIFLSLHMIKHFIISGLTVQMMMDVALYLKKHKSEIDVDRFWNTINSLHYDKLLNSILWAMVRYCGFNKDDLPGICAKAPEHVDVILSDLEEGGWMGYTDKEAREEGWHEYNRQKLIKDKSDFRYFVYMIRWKWAQYMSALFPSVNHLAKRYPYVQKHAWLIPYAWTHRLVFRGVNSVRHGILTNQIVTDENSINETAKTRIDLFRKLDMM